MRLLHQRLWLCAEQRLARSEPITKDGQPASVKDSRRSTKGRRRRSLGRAPVGCRRGPDAESLNEIDARRIDPHVAGPNARGLRLLQQLRLAVLPDQKRRRPIAATTVCRSSRSGRPGRGRAHARRRARRHPHALGLSRTPASSAPRGDFETLGRAYRGDDRLDDQLTAQFKLWLRDETKGLTLDDAKPMLSRIFLWYAGDFETAYAATPRAPHHVVTVAEPLAPVATIH